MTELLGRKIAVTRPRAQASALAALISAAGGEAVLCPLLEIAPIDDAESLRAAIAGLGSYALAIFISPNAVAYSVPAMLAGAGWPQHLQAFAIGPSSVALLASYGIEALAPLQRFDSEALLELPELQRERVAGKRALILRGNGGRELIAQTLAERACQVDCVSCYQRGAPHDVAPLAALLRCGELDAVTVSSSEALHNLVALLDGETRARLIDTPLFVPHRRIAELALALGLQAVFLTAPNDAGILAALRAHAWRER